MITTVLLSLFLSVKLNLFLVVVGFHFLTYAKVKCSWHCFLNNNKNDYLLFTVLVIKFQTKLLTELIEL